MSYSERTIENVVEVIRKMPYQFTFSEAGKFASLFNERLDEILEIHKTENGNENLYPIFIKKYKKDYCVFIPDLQGYTDETTIEKAIESAKEYIRNIRELRGGYLVPPSNVEEAINKTKKDAADDIFNYSDGLLVYVRI